LDPELSRPPRDGAGSLVPALCGAVDSSLAERFEQEICYSLRSIILFANIDVIGHILVIDKSVLAKSNMSWRKYRYSTSLNLCDHFSQSSAGGNCDLILVLLIITSASNISITTVEEK
jgi:hypothetical protein